jgi:MOSC domain-containing protein YiiM
MEPHFTLTVEGVYLGGDGHASAPAELLHATLEGIRKDRHFGFTKLAGVREKRHHPKGTEIWNGRQWSAVSVEELAVIASNMGINTPLKAEWLGANLLFSGHPDLTHLPPTTRLVFPEGASLLVWAENLPCVWPGNTMEVAGGIPHEHASQFGKAALHRRGLVGWVERAGIIRRGDSVKVFLPQVPLE